MICKYQGKLGELFIRQEGEVLTAIYFSEPENTPICSQHTPLMTETMRQLDEYFEGKRHELSLPISAHSTSFKEKVWKLISEIPYGATATYKEIAELAGSPKACRAVGGACNCNPLPIIVPCHRVVGSDGSLTGFAGGIPMKIALLELEKS